MKLQCETLSLEGFVQYLVTSMICRGYWFYITGVIPEGKEAFTIDQKITEKYRASISSSTRWRQKKLGKANVRYLRFERFFVLMATRGSHRFFEEEADIKDIRQVPIRIGGYSISFRRDGQPSAGEKSEGRRVHVRIEDVRFKELVADFEHWATRLSAEKLAGRLYNLPYRGYAPVRRQLCQLLRSVNKKRRAAGLSQLPRECLFFHRTPVKVFATS